jgi:hypothetical protein
MDYDETQPPVSPTDMGIKEQAVFGMPFDDGSEVLFCLEKSYADRLIARAAAANMVVPEFLSDLLKQEMKNPQSPWNLVALPKDWMVCMKGYRPKILAAIFFIGFWLWYNYFGDQDHDRIPDILERVWPSASFLLHLFWPWQ